MKELREILLENIKGKINTVNDCNLDTRYYEESDIEALKKELKRKSFTLRNYDKQKYQLVVELEDIDKVFNKFSQSKEVKHDKNN